MKYSPDFLSATLLSFTTRFFTWAGLLLILGMGTLLHASDLPQPVVLDAPFAPNIVIPDWLGVPQIPQTTFAALNLPIMAPDMTSSLLVTVYFQEKDGGFLRITWQGTQNSQLLSDNFYEGIGMSNQRSLLITADTLAGDGTLNFQSSDSTLGIKRIKLEWLASKNSLVSPQLQDLLVTPSSGQTQLAKNLQGDPAQNDPAAWHSQVVTVPITDQPERIEDGVEFSVQLDNLPASARLSLKEAGLPWDKRLVVWINQQRAGTITPAVPDLLDDGFLDDTPDSYVGWRDGSFYVPVSLLKLGVNTLQFSDEDEIPSTNPPITTSTTTTTTTPPLAIKNLVLQLNYPATTEASPDPEQTNSAPTGTITPDSSSSNSTEPATP